MKQRALTLSAVACTLSLTGIALWRANLATDTHVSVLTSTQKPEYGEEREEKKLEEKVEAFVVAKNEVLLPFNSGNYLKALAVIEEKLKNPETTQILRAWLNGQLPVVLTAAGWLQINLGNCRVGTSYLTRSLQLRQSAENMKGLAYCYYHNREFRVAIPFFRAYLQQNGDDVQMLLMYTDLLTELGEYEFALSHLRKSRPDLTSRQREQIKAKIAAIELEEKNAQDQALVETNNFRISYQQQHRELIAEITETLTTALDYYVEHYGFFYPEAKIEVTVYPATTFREILADRPDWVDGYFDGRIRIPVENENFSPARLHQALRHELVHALLAHKSGFRRLPDWFEEGLAQYLSCIGDCPVVPSVSGGILPASELTRPFLTYDRAKAKRAYRQSLFIITLLEPERNPSSDLKTVIAGISPYRGVSSNDLLAPISKDFANLYAQARKQVR